MVPLRPMTRWQGHHDTHRIGAIGGAHRARGAGTTERLGQLAVVHHLATGDIA